MVLRLRSMMRNARIRARALRIQLKVLLRGPSNRGRRMRQSLTAIRCEISVWRGLNRPEFPGDFFAWISQATLA